MSCVDHIRRQLVDSELMTAAAADGQIERWLDETPVAEEASGQALLDWLVEKHKLTEFQGEALRAGHTGPFMLGPYRVFGHMAAGRLGDIYRAVHEEFQQPVSLKVFPSALNDDPEKVARMQREFRVTVELDHANVVRSFHIGREGDVYYLAFEDLQGQTLQDRLDAAGALPFAEACRLMRDAAAGLGHLHEKGLVHRDVRPANLWLSQPGTLKLMELGAVRDALGLVVEPEDDEITGSDTVIGTFDYMAPEQAQDAHVADHRSDIYSLGCTFYHCLVGRPPFVEKNPIRLVMRHATEPPAPLTDELEDVPPPLAEAVASMLAKRPQDRYQKTAEVIWALQPYVEEVPEPQQDEVREEFLQWLCEVEGPVEPKPRESRSPELAQFLQWLADGRPLVD